MEIADVFVVNKADRDGVGAWWPRSSRCCPRRGGRREDGDRERRWRPATKGRGRSPRRCGTSRDGRGRRGRSPGSGEQGSGAARGGGAAPESWARSPHRGCRRPSSTATVERMAGNHGAEDLAHDPVLHRPPRTAPGRLLAAFRASAPRRRGPSSRSPHRSRSGPRPSSRVATVFTIAVLSAPAAPRDSIDSISAHHASDPRPGPALFTTNTSAISMIPGLERLDLVAQGRARGREASHPRCRRSRPRPGRRRPSRQVTSLPAASTPSARGRWSREASSGRRVAIERMKTPGSVAWACIRIRSPRSPPR